MVLQLEDTDKQRMPRRVRGFYSAWDLRDAYWDGTRLEIHMGTGRGKVATIRQVDATLYLALIIVLRQVSLSMQLKELEIVALAGARMF